MKNAELAKENSSIELITTSKIKYLFGLSRVYIGFFVLAQAALGAILALKYFPKWDVMVMGSIACLSGSFSLVAFNDLLDVPIDKTIINEEKENKSFDISEAFERHPLAKGLISYKLGIFWVSITAVISMLATAYFNPSMLWILPTIAFFVSAYSLLSMRSPLKVLAVAVAVTLGGLAGWIAVAPAKGILFYLFAAWTFLWEIGGRNVPNDFNDVESDKKVGIKTFPVVFGCDRCAEIIMIFLFLVSIVSIPMIWLSTFSVIYTFAGLIISIYFLILPGWRLLKNAVPEVSQKLYNRSAFYPIAIFGLFITRITF